MPRPPAGAKPIKDCTPTTAYQRGRSAAILKLHKIREAYNQAFEIIRARAERAEAAQGIGKCAGCRFFTAHTPHWGFCNITKAMEKHPAWPMPWAQIQRADFKTEPFLSVSNTFGCVLFAVKK